MTFARSVRDAEVEGVGLLRRLELLDAALELWRGPAFDEVAGEEWAIGEVERLQELRLVALERRFDTMLALGRHVEALPALSQAVREHPLRDRLVGHHMLALFRSGRQAEAARAFQAHRSRLGQQLGLEPGIALAELDRRIVSGDATLLGEGSAPSSGRSVRGYRLAEQLGQARSRWCSVLRSPPSTARWPSR
ncbi:MAG: BTAD domain-containing putative transcriptional regulator [Acidimicrobiales bacterium]